MKINIGLGYIGQLTNLLLVYLTTPILVDELGLDDYKYIGLLGLLMAGIQFYDFGLSRIAVVKTQEYINNVLKKCYREIISGIFIYEIIIIIIIISLIGLTLRLLGIHEWEIYLYINIIIGLEIIKSFYNNVIGITKDIYIIQIINTLSNAGKIVCIYVLLFNNQISIKNILTIYLVISLAGVIGFYIFKKEEISVNFVNDKSRYIFKLRIKDVIKGFAVNICIGITTFFITIDKIFLSIFGTAESFSLYSVAAIVASTVMMIGNPIVQATIPNLIENYNEENNNKVQRKLNFYFTILISVGMIIYFYMGQEILTLWIKNDFIVNSIFLLIPILVISNLINLLASINYNINIIYANNKSLIKITIISILIFSITIFFLKNKINLYGIASLMLISNIIYYINIKRLKKI